MEQPEGWVVPGKEDWVCLLKKAIYGLKQASRQWNAKIHKSLLEIGFTRTYSDAGVYVYSRESGDHTCIVILYVDDLLLMGDSKPFIEEVKRKLKLEYQMTDFGPVERFFGFVVSVASGRYSLIKLNTFKQFWKGSRCTTVYLRILHYLLVPFWRRTLEHLQKVSEPCTKALLEASCMLC